MNCKLLNRHISTMSQLLHAQNPYLHPTPITTPAVRNSAPIFLVEDPLKISPKPNKLTPCKFSESAYLDRKNSESKCLKNPNPVQIGEQNAPISRLLAPSFLMTLALTSAKIEIHAHVNLPTKLIVLGLESLRSTRTTWMMPQEYVVPMNQNERTLQAPITTC